MLSILRAGDPPRRSTAHQSTVSYEEGSSSQTFYPVGSRYFTAHTISNSTSFLNPPMHIHARQVETFRVLRGTGVWQQPSHPDPARREVVRRAGESITLAPNVRHTFSNPSPDQPLEVLIKLDPEGANAIDEQRMFRNFFGYVDDCRVAGLGPSIFQLQLLLYTADVSVAVPVPFANNAVVGTVSRAVQFVLGVVIGEWLLGYKRDYPEYSKGSVTEGMGDRASLT